MCYGCGMSNLDVQLHLGSGSAFHIRPGAVPDVETVIITLDGVDLFFPLATFRTFASWLDEYAIGEDRETVLP